MKYKIFALATLVCSMMYMSCTNDDDTYAIDEEWKKYNEQIVMETAAKKNEYSERKCLSGDGNIYWKNVTDFIPEEKSAPSTKVTEDGTPYFTDSVVVRYTGWYLNKDGTKFTFDTTEGANNGVARTFLVGGTVEGFRTQLQYMTVGEQVEICIPQRVGYGATAQSYIPAYTTLWFRIKLLKIIPGNPGEYTKR